jgi:hypothetical protein
MCALCGVLGGGEHWSDAAAIVRDVSPHERRRERANRVAAANRVLRRFGMSLGDWQGSAYVLATATGKSEIIDGLAHLWPAAERLSGRAIDPLDPDLLGRLEAGDG